MKNKRLDVVAKIIFYGSIWGLLEATLGYVLHLIPGYFSGSIMFPIVLFILYRAYKSLGSRKAIFFVAMIAIMIKSVNLLMPFLIPARTINPMIAMFLEAGLVFAVIPMLDSDRLTHKITAVFAASILWRVAFIGYQGINYLMTDFVSYYIRSFTLAIDFILIYGLLGSLIAFVMFTLSEKSSVIKRFDQLKISPVVSFELLILALVFTLSL